MSRARKVIGGSRSRPGALTHRGLVAIEAILLVGVIKDWIFGLLERSSFQNWGKVLLVMATTVGIFGGLFLVVERLTARGFSHTHGLAKQLPIVLPAFVLHVALLFLLFLLYARMLRLQVF